jgi:hypothetical protein
MRILRTTLLLTACFVHLTARAGWCPAIVTGGNPSGAGAPPPARSGSTPSLPDRSTVESQPAFPGTEGTPVPEAAPPRDPEGESAHEATPPPAGVRSQAPNEATEAQPSPATAPEPSSDTVHPGAAGESSGPSIGHGQRRVPPPATHPVNAREAGLNVAPPPVTPVGAAPRRRRSGLGGGSETEVDTAPLSPIVRVLRAFGLYLVVMFVGLLLLYQQFRRSAKPRKAARKF